MPYLFITKLSYPKRVNKNSIIIVNGRIWYIKFPFVKLNGLLKITLNKVVENRTEFNTSWSPIGYRDFYVKIKSSEIDITGIIEVGYIK